MLVGTKLGLDDGVSVGAPVGTTLGVSYKNRKTKSFDPFSQTRFLNF